MNANLIKLTDMTFPISIIEHDKSDSGALFTSHFHENHLQLFYFTSGKAKIYCNQNVHEVSSSDVILINKNELHYGENDSRNLHYFVFRIDIKLLSSCGVDSIADKYITPLFNGLLVLQNNIADKKILTILNVMIDEYQKHEDGFELKLLSCIFELLGNLVRYYKGKLYNQQSADILMRKTKRFSDVFEFIEQHYFQTITLSELAKKAHMSEGYFCRMFKQSTGRTPMNYINHLRIEKSVILLNQGICNVTEAGMSVGFDDINYFSRVFKKHMLQSPEHYLKNDRKYFL